MSALNSVIQFYFRNPLILLVLLGGHLTAQTFTTLHSFTGGRDGAQPWSGLAISGNILYGTALYGGAHNKGTVFALNTDGTGFKTLYSFSGGYDGGNPVAGVVLSSDMIFGSCGSAYDDGSGGAVFGLHTDGTGFSILHQFANGVDGTYPGELVLSGTTLYGTTSSGGSFGYGIVFRVQTDGTGFTNLQNFGGGFDGGNVSYGNASAGLVLSGNTLYGTTFGRGEAVFRLNTDGTSYTNLINLSD
jgi:uncharacterized repeat protein (TIGR03803 family)